VIKINKEVLKNDIKKSKKQKLKYKESTYEVIREYDNTYTFEELLGKAISSHS